MLGRIVDELVRREGPRILAGLIRRLGGNFDLAEDCLQDAYERALAAWPSAGIPENPAAWLTTVAKRCAIDRLRRSRRNVDEGDLILEQLAVEEPEPVDAGGVPDDRLRLMFTCCHPALAEPAQMALALRTLCGLSTREIARAFLEPEATTAQRLVRAKKKISEARIPYVVPSREELPDRLAAVLAAIYLVFNEGYSATEGAALVRPDLSGEAMRRREPYQVQAAIAALHVKAVDAASTDWVQIGALYGALYAMMPTAIVELNAAAAAAMVEGPEKGLERIDRVEANGELGDYHLLPAARADLLRRAGQDRAAATHYRRAIALARNPAERLYLERRLREVASLAGARSDKGER